MPAWKVADSLDTLLAQLNALAPARSRASDGSIGDAAHASRSNASDHNPWWSLAGQPYVTARDYTHDVAGGLDCQRLADALRGGRDQRVKYVIWNRQIMSGTGGPSPWVWRPYTGTNPHNHHLHLSVVADLRALTRIPWLLPGLTTASPAPQEADMPLSTQDLALIADIIRREVAAAAIPREAAAAVWNAAIPDFYAPVRPDGQPPAIPAFAALGWSAANAGKAHDAAADAADGVDELKARPAAGPDPDKRYRLVAEQ